MNTKTDTRTTKTNRPESWSKPGKLARWTKWESQPTNQRDKHTDNQTDRQTDRHRQICTTMCLLWVEIWPAQEYWPLDLESIASKHLKDKQTIWEAIPSHYHSKESWNTKGKLFSGSCTALITVRKRCGLKSPLDAYLVINMGQGSILHTCWRPGNWNVYHIDMFSGLITSTCKEETFLVFPE